MEHVQYTWGSSNCMKCDRVKIASNISPSCLVLSGGTHRGLLSIYCAYLDQGNSVAACRGFRDTFDTILVASFWLHRHASFLYMLSFIGFLKYLPHRLMHVLKAFVCLINASCTLKTSHNFQSPDQFQYFEWSVTGILSWTQNYQPAHLVHFAKHAIPPILSY